VPAIRCCANEAPMTNALYNPHTLSSSLVKHHRQVQENQGG
jgi:hypothetical protein